MWRRFSEMICCPECSGQLALNIIQGSQAEVSDDHLQLAAEFGLAKEVLCDYVDEGLLHCERCRLMFPVIDGVPILLTYPTPLHAEFLRRHNTEIAKLDLDVVFPQQTPPPGEEQVLESFSREWGDYEYDGVIWELNYADHEKRFLAELGNNVNIDTTSDLPRFIEIGCGIGITDLLAHKNFKVDAIGVDLSLAALQATKHYKDNPFLHFVQASVFKLPFPNECIDIVYSRGVLHHTYSTETAFRKTAALCKQSGLLYVWVYSRGSILASPIRVVAYMSEALLRPILSKFPNSLAARAILGIAALPYMAYNRIRRLSDATIEPLTFGRAVHAARDRFTPRFAHRHPPAQLMSWFKEEGFEQVEQVDWRTMPTADHGDYSRNVGVRAIKT